MKRRRLLITGVLLLLGGAIVNVAVAWGSAVLIGLTDVEEFASASRLYADGVRTVWLSTRLASLQVIWMHDRLATATNSNGDEPHVLLPQWITLVHDAPEDQVVLCWTVEARGAPFLSLWSKIEEWRDGADGSTRWIPASGSIELPNADFIGSNYDLPRVLPLVPIWPGFAINTIFYAAMLWGGWVVFFVPGMVRRRIRRRRGLCPACAYPTWGGGTSPVCTECGKAVKS